MAADGSIIIETELDTSGIDRGLSEIKSAIDGRMGEAETGVNRVLDAIADAVGKTDVTTGAGRLIGTLVSAFRGGADEVGSAAAYSANRGAEAVGGEGSAFTSGGMRLIAAAANGVRGAAGLIAEAASGAADGGASAVNETEGEYSVIGANLMNALCSGIASGASALYAKAAQIASNVIGKLKGIFGIHSPSRVFRDEIGKMLMLGLREGIAGNSEAVLAACRELAENMLADEKKYASEKQRIERENSEADEAVRIEEYARRLLLAKDEAEKEKLIAEERLRLKKKADNEYLSQLKENANRQREVIETLKDDITAVYKEIAEYTEDSLEPIVKSCEKLENRLKAFAEETGSGYIKSTVTVKEKASSKIGARRYEEKEFDVYSLADQQESIDILLRYCTALELVSERLKGISPETARAFKNSLADMDVEDGVLFAETLAAAGEAEFEDYIEKWEQKNILAEALARQFYSDEFTEAVDDCTEYMKKELEALGMEIPDGFFASGSASAAEFGKGFGEGLNDILEDARELIEGFGGYASEVIGGGARSVVNNNNYYSSYSISGTRSTAAESIRAAEAAALLNKYRGLN